MSTAALDGLFGLLRGLDGGVSGSPGQAGDDTGGRGTDDSARTPPRPTLPDYNFSQFSPGARRPAPGTGLALAAQDHPLSDRLTTTSDWVGSP